MNDSVEVHQVDGSSRQTGSFTGSQTGENCGGLEGSANQAPRRASLLLDSNGEDVTPVDLYHVEPGVLQSKPSSFSLDEISTTSCSLSTKLWLTDETEDSAPKLDVPINSLAPCEVRTKRDKVRHVSEEMLDEVVDIYFCETDTISLLDIPNIFMSVDATDAETIEEGNIRYAEICKNRDSNKYVGRSMQTFGGAPKNKEIQSDKIVVVDEGTAADSFCDENETLESQKADHPKSNVNSSKGQTKREEKSSSSTADTGCTISSLLEMEMCRNPLHTEPEPQLSMLPESFQKSLIVMERCIVQNRQLPILQEPDSMMKPWTEEVNKESEESSSSATLERLWAFSCEFTSKSIITSMALNKENPDIVAVGYGDLSRNQKPGLICCWSLKNPMWPRHVFHCHSCVTSLDFSVDNLLAVGMYDGTVAIYNVESQNNEACITNSSECLDKHRHPVWHVNWTAQEISLPGDERECVEVLISVCADSRMYKWLPSIDGLQCIDLIDLKGGQHKRETATGNNEETTGALSAVTPGLCVDFHPTNSGIYLAGTREGLIHKCSLSFSQHFLHTYQKHTCSVNHIEWSPFSSDVFLSCSSDWTIQLWKQDCFTPVLSFTSTQMAVHAVRWSPNWSTIFGAINEQQMEIWDLNSSIAAPIIVHPAAPGVKMTSLLFARGTDCVLVGDSDGQVIVYQLKNLSVGEDKQMDSLEDIIHSEVSKL